MKRILFLVVTFLMCAYLNVNAADWAISISAASFEDEEEATVWVEGSGFDYAWGGAASEQNIYSNERNTVKVHIDGWSECIGNVNVTLGRMGLHAGGWAWLEGSTKYYNDEEGLKAALTPDDFDENGRAVLELTLPAGMKPAADYAEHTADTPTLWLFQVVGTNSAADHECGESYCNFIIDVTEEIVESTGGGGDEGQESEDVEANNWAISATATSFDDEEAFWVEGTGFHYGWDKVAPADLIYSNDNNVVTLHVDGYTTCLGNVNITLGRMGLHDGGWAFIDPVHFYNDEEEGALTAALTADDFDNGRAVIEITLPDGMKPAADYPEHTEDTPTLWLLQVVGTNSAADHACGASFCNFIIDVTEEIGDGTGVSEYMSTLLVYPNPVKAGNLITLDASRFTDAVNVKVFNLGGQVVAEQSISPSSAASISADFAPGIYTVEITDGNTRGIQKMIVR